VNIYETKLAIIGRGTWPLKIKSSLEGNFQGLGVRVFSAREVIANAAVVHESGFNAIWIATQPSLQFRLLENLSGISQTIVLEKPLGSNSAEIQRLIHCVTAHPFGVVAPSNPWSYETACMETVELIKNEGLIKAKIEITRGGPNRRSYLSPVEDWIPHDLYLLGELFDSDAIAFTEISGNGETAVAKFFSEIFQTEITVNSGFTKERVAEIVYSKDSKVIKTNLLSGRILIDGIEHSFQAKDTHDAISRNYLDTKNWGKRRLINAATLQSEVFSSLEKLK